MACFLSLKKLTVSHPPPLILSDMGRTSTTARRTRTYAGWSRSIPPAVCSRTSLTYTRTHIKQLQWRKLLPQSFIVSSFHISVAAVPARRPDLWNQSAGNFDGGLIIYLCSRGPVCTNVRFLHVIHSDLLRFLLLFVKAFLCYINNIYYKTCPLQNLVTIYTHITKQYNVP